jgi:hypothetical protein
MANSGQKRKSLKPAEVGIPRLMSIAQASVGDVLDTLTEVFDDNDGSTAEVPIDQVSLSQSHTQPVKREAWRPHNHRCA